VEVQLRRIQQPSIANWEEMKERTKEKYLPIDYEQMMFKEMLQLRQGSLTMDQYTDRFHELTTRSRIVETEQQMLARYHNELRSDMHKEMLIMRLINIKEAFRLVLRIEKHMRVSSGRRMMSTDPRLGRMAVPSSLKPPLPYGQPRGTGIKDQKGKSTTTGEGPRYYKCKGLGHFVVMCPIGDKKIAFICGKELMAMETIEETEAEETSNEEEEH
jgi:hypothetical protein